MDKPTFDLLVWIWTSIGLIIFLVLLTITAPYGRHSKRTWGVTIPDRIGWFIMEVPALIIFLWLIISGKSEKTVVVWIISALYVFHYINRAVIYPWRIRTTGKRMPLVVALMAVCFNFVKKQICFN